MPLEPGDKIWIAEAPDGIPSSGPNVIFDLTKYGIDYQETIDFYERRGWTVTPAVVTE